jgi:HAD superfamily hydrolase (TIGR01509 family)
MSSLAELYAAKHPTTWKEFERGEIDEAEVARRYFTDRPCDLEGYKAILRAGYRWLDGIEALLSDLSAAGVRMHALSNYPAWYRLIEERLAVSRYVAWSFVSSDLGVRKPDPEIYLRAARTLGVDPAECLFVDDRAKNCAGAETVGMAAIQFRGAANLRAALVAHGVLPRPAPG